MPSFHLHSGSRALAGPAIRVSVAIALALLAVRLFADALPLRLKLPTLESPTIDIYPPPAVPEDPVKRAVFQRINRDRAAAGLPAVAWDEAASKVADSFCAYQAAERTRGHFLTDGVPPYARMGFAGVFGMQMENSVSWVTNATVFSDPNEKLALEGHEGMMAEKPPFDGHRRTILDPEATHVGVGWATQNGRFQMAQEFLVRGLARLSLSVARARRAAVQFEGRPLGGSRLVFVTVAHEQSPRPLTREEASGRGSYSYPQAILSYIPEGYSLMRVTGTRSEDRLRIRGDRSFSFEFRPSRAGLYTFVFYTATRPGTSPRPGGSASLWFE